jgi:asparagine synthase (glutamine-hydrolysing)
LPGLTLWLPPPTEVEASARFRHAQRLMIRGPEDRAEVDAEHERCIVGHVGYPGYPVRCLAAPESTIVVEGHAYDRTADQLGHDLQEVVRRAFEATDARDVVSDFVTEVDGDFLVVAVAAAGDRCIVFSDALGRLPAYLQVGPAGLVLAREPKFVGGIAGNWGFDRLGLAQSFWLGYPLGERTLFDGIERTGAGFFLEARPAADGVQSSRASTYAFRCDDKSDLRGLKASAADLSSRFTVATEGRARAAGDAPVVVSLSGGNDSRTVLGSLGHARDQAIAATFRRAGGGHSADVLVAERIAGSLGIPWESIELSPVGADEEERLVWMKDGLNPVTMAFILPFLEETRRRWGDRTVLLTGDGGDKVFPDLRPVRRPRSLDGLVDAVVEDAAMMPAAAVEALFGLATGSLVDELRSRLDAYPEPSFEHKFVRWQIAERARKWLFEGEDRARSFVWQASPFYALPVFEAALAVPDDLKTDLRFYAEVQRQIDPILLTQPHADTGLLIDSARFRRRAATRRLALRALGPLGRPLLKRLKADRTDPSALRSDAVSRLRDADLAGSRLMQTMDPTIAADLVAKATRRGLQNWSTVLLLDRLWAERIPLRGDVADTP